MFNSRFVILLILIAFAPLSNAGEPWDGTDKALGAAALTLWAVDFGQTRYIANNPDRFYENNPLLGKHPSVSRVNNYFIGVGIAGYLLADHLSSANRKMFLATFAVIELGVTRHNRYVGIKIDF
jgi:hypothetical protein